MFQCTSWTCYNVHAHLGLSTSIVYKPMPFCIYNERYVHKGSHRSRNTVSQELKLYPAVECEDVKVRIHLARFCRVRFGYVA